MQSFMTGVVIIKSDSAGHIYRAYMHRKLSGLSILTRTWRVVSLILTWRSEFFLGFLIHVLIRILLPNYFSTRRFRL